MLPTALISQLSQMPQCTHAQVDSLNCSADINCRLASLGLLPNHAVHMIRTTKRGAVLIKVNGMLLALSTGLSQNIFVKDICNDTK